MNSFNPINAIPKWLAIIIGGIGFFIGFTQPLWMAFIYIVIVMGLAVVYTKVIKR